MRHKEERKISIPTLKVGDRAILTSTQDSLGKGSLVVIKEWGLYSSRVEVLRAHDYDGSVLSYPWDNGHQCGRPELFPRRNGKCYGYNVNNHRLRLETASFVCDDDILLL